MRIKIFNCDIDINVRKAGGYVDPANKETMDFLNYVAIWAFNSAKYRSSEYPATAELDRKAAMAIYDALVERGYYKSHRSGIYVLPGDFDTD